MVQQTALGLLMSFSTAAVCLVPSDTGPKTETSSEPRAVMCPAPPPPPASSAIDLTAGGRGGDTKPSTPEERPALRRLRLAEDTSVPRRDYFDAREDEDEPSRRAPRPYRPRAREARLDPTELVSGLESTDGDRASEARIHRFVRFFTDTREGRQGFAAALARSGRYEEIIARALDDRRLPRALAATALVESGFSATAESPVGAAGLWQFMPGTARAYGLRVDRGLDERLSPWKASLAASEHLADLYDHFRSWELALAAYNMGFNALTSRLERHKVKTFWELADIEGGLPAETSLYVPRVLAAAVVMTHLAAFGFDDVDRGEPLAAAELEAPSGMPIHLLARAAGLPVRTFRDLNPELVGSAVPRTDEPIVVHVPTKGFEQTRALVARLERGEIDADDLERPRERTAWSRDGARGRDDDWRRRDGRERDVAWDAPRAPYEEAEPSYRRTRGRPSWARQDTDLEDDGRAAPYAREEYGARRRDFDRRDDDRRDDRRAYRDDDRDRDEAPRENPLRRRRTTPSTSTVFYRTAEGDTAKSIGKTFGLGAAEVSAQNGLEGDAPLATGTLLRLRVPQRALDRMEKAEKLGVGAPAPATKPSASAEPDAPSDANGAAGAAQGDGRG